MICRKCNNEFNELPAWLIIKSLCRPCSRDIWKQNRVKRKERGTLKTMKMPTEYHSNYLKKWVVKNREKVIGYAKKARINNPLKSQARDLLNKALKRGLLIKEPCIVCFSVKSEAHHEDYNKPLEVKWLCRKHHKDLHKKATT